MPRLTPDLKDTFRLLIPALRGWRACVDSFTQDSQLRNYIAECNSLITTEEIKNLRSSKPYLEGANLIHMAERGTKLSLRQFTLVRDLLTRLTQATGTRPGALNNVLVTDYETSRLAKATASSLCLSTNAHRTVQLCSVWIQTCRRRWLSSWKRSDLPSLTLMKTSYSSKTTEMAFLRAR